MTEYLVISALVLALLAFAGRRPTSALGQLLDAFALAFARLSHFLSLP